MSSLTTANIQWADRLHHWVWLSVKKEKYLRVNMRWEGPWPSSSPSVGFIPMALMAQPSSWVLMVPPPSISNSLNACFSSATCSSDSLSAITPHRSLRLPPFCAMMWCLLMFYAPQCCCFWDTADLASPGSQRANTDQAHSSTRLAGEKDAPWVWFDKKLWKFLSFSFLNIIEEQNFFYNVSIIIKHISWSFLTLYHIFHYFLYF